MQCLNKIYFFKEYILKGVVNAALGQEIGSVSKCLTNYPKTP